MLSGAAALSKSDNDIEQPHETKRKVVIDDRTVTFELMKNVTQLPKISREERSKFQVNNINVNRRHLLCGTEHRIRRWLMKFEIASLTLIYLSTFVAVNAVFAGLWYIDQERCCEDSTLTFSQVFDFAVQTSSTIGYGGYWPKGYFANFLVVILSVLSVLISTVYAGLLLFKFITPEANIELSDVIAMSNIMGVPCVEIRVGNADSQANSLINAEASLNVMSVHQYKCPDSHEMKTMSSTEALELAVSTQHVLDGVWTIRHFIDERSPLYGFRLDEFPGNTIKSFQLSIKAIQFLTKGQVFAQTAYQVADIMIGHRFEDQAVWNPDTKKAYFDFAKMSSTMPSLVWYPKQSNPFVESDCDD
jgi:inward rectifier potassium channel